MFGNLQQDRAIYLIVCLLPGPGGELAAPGAEDDEQVVVEVDDVDRAVPEAGEEGGVGVELVLQLVARQPH